MEPPFGVYLDSSPHHFVSYSHDDCNLVYPEIERLHLLGYHLWYDEGIEPGAIWTARLDRALVEAVGLLLFLSPNAAGSRWVLREVHRAIDLGKRVIPVYLIETSLEGPLGFLLAGIHAIYKYRLDDTDYLKKLLEALSESPPETQADSFFARGVKELEQGKHERAVRMLNEAIRISSGEWADPYLKRGEAWLEGGAIPAAICDFTEAIKVALCCRLDRTVATAYFHRARCHLRLRHYDDSLADFRRAKEIDPQLDIAPFLTLRLRLLKMVSKAATFCRVVMRWTFAIRPRD